MQKFIQDTFNFNNITNRGFLRSWYAWMIDSRERTYKRLDTFLQEQADNPDIELWNIAQELRTDYPDADKRIVKILNLVNSRCTYITDKVNFGKLDYWMTAAETWKTKRSDCLLEDTPLVMSHQGWTDIHEVADLIPRDYPINEKYFPPKELWVLGQGGFNKVNWLIKKNTNKDIYRIRSGKSVIDVTEDHKILCRENRNNVFIEAKDFKSKRFKVIGTPISTRFMNHNLNYDIGWVYGLFAAEGYCGKGNWRIYNTDRQILEKAKLILEGKRLFGIRNLKFDLVEYDCFKKDRVTNKGVRTKTLFVLRPVVTRVSGRPLKGSLKKFIDRWYPFFYTSLHHKKVPSQVLNGSKEAKQGFLDGHFVGDKHHSTSKILMFGMMILLESLEKTTYNLRDSIGKNMSITQKKTPIKAKIRSSSNIGKTTKLVYDLNVDDPHYFAAGDILVHNCDDQNSLIYLLARYSGISDLQIWSCLGEVKEGYHYWCLYFSFKHDRWFSIDSTYYPDLRELDRRMQFVIDDNDYQRIDFIFNEDMVFKSL